MGGRGGDASRGSAPRRALRGGTRAPRTRTAEARARFRLFLTLALASRGQGVSHGPVTQDCKRVVAGLICARAHRCSLRRTLLVGTDSREYPSQKLACYRRFSLLVRYPNMSKSNGDVVRYRFLWYGELWSYSLAKRFGRECGVPSYMLWRCAFRSLRR